MGDIGFPPNFPEANKTMRILVKYHNFRNMTQLKNIISVTSYVGEIDIFVTNNLNIITKFERAEIFLVFNKRICVFRVLFWTVDQLLTLNNWHLLKPVFCYL